MKIAAFQLLSFFFFVSSPILRAEDLEAKAYALEWDHWLWIERIVHRDPTYTPTDFAPDNRKIRMFTIQSAKKAYEACGIVVNDGESFIYGPATMQMIARLGGENAKRVSLIHQTIADWKAGRTDQWHLNWKLKSTTKTEGESTAKKAG